MGCVWVVGWWVAASLGSFEADFCSFSCVGGGLVRFLVRLGGVGVLLVVVSVGEGVFLASSG